MRSFRALSLCATAALGIAGAASADTICTFADPATTGATPVFSLTGNVLSGGWAGSGLNLLTPGLGVGDYPNATFQMTPLTVNLLFPGLYSTTGGTVTFLDQNSVLLFQITFLGGLLNSPLSFGASDFVGQGVTFSGPIIPNGLYDESFSFSFANFTPTQAGFNVTSAFTSSANVEIPGPATLAGLAVGGLVAGRRRRR